MNKFLKPHPPIFFGAANLDHLAKGMALESLAPIDKNLKESFLVESRIPLGTFDSERQKTGILYRTKDNNTYLHPKVRH